MPEIEFQILYEDNHIIAVNKPFGVLSQGDMNNEPSMIEFVKQYIQEKYNKPGAVYLALLHRLDRPVGGVLLMAKTSKAAGRLSEDFKNRKIQKTYYAVCEKAPENQSGTLIHYLKKTQDKNIVRGYDKPVTGAQEAILDYELLKVDENKSLIKVNPLTGRSHQIRVQLSKIGCTIVGDVKYGKSDFLPDQSIALYSHSITFEHPTKKEIMTITAPYPKHRPFSIFSLK